MNSSVFENFRQRPYPVSQARAQEVVTALNNTAVSLLSRQNYQEAMNTFKDALAITRATFPLEMPSLVGSEATVDGFKLPSDFEVDEPLHKASRSLARSSSAKQWSENLTRNCFVELTDDVGLETVVALAERCQSHQDYHWEYGVRIHLCGDSSDLNIDLDSAFILYNYAIACWMCAQDCSSMKRRPKTLDGASRLLHLSYNILSNISLEDLDSLEAVKFSLGIILVLQNLIKISTVLGQMDRVQTFSSQLSHWQDLIQGSNSTKDTWDCKNRNAAGAA